MVKKQEKKKDLYNFDKESDEEKVLKKKNKADAKSASKKKKKQRNRNGQAEDLSKKYEDEIIIGVTKYPEKNNKNGKAQSNRNQEKTNHTKHNEKISKKRSEKEIKKKEKSKAQNKQYVSLNNEYILEDAPNLIEEQKKIKRAEKRAKILKAFLIILLFIGMVTFAMVSPIFNIEKITVVGNSKLTENEVVSLSKITIGENLFRVGKLKTINNIKENAYVESVTISKKIPNSIEITIEERTPTFMLEYGNAYIYINNQGYMLETTNEKLELPIILGYSTPQENLTPGNRLQEEDLVKLGTVIKIMNAAKNNEISDKITTINISNEENYTIYMESEKKTAYLGDCSNLETRMLYVAGIMNSEKDIEGEIFVNMNLNTDNAFFRETV